MRCVMPSILAEDEQKPMHMLNITSYSVNWTQVFTESQSCVWDWLRFWDNNQKWHSHKKW